ATTWWELVDEPTALAAGGAGLTLAILRHLAERHRGELVVTVQRTRYHLRLVLPERQGSR
ncbi:MAG: hypothetical protein HUU35_07295, partial [Armatimonadetes bacterium]|nr:hypothetical protein [Armatimonadota bacterium]